jgi:hypothetical protein
MMSLAMKQSSSQDPKLTRFGFALAIFVVLYVSAVIGFIIIY